MRTRTRLGDSKIVRYGDLATGEPILWKLDHLYETIEDVNNGRARPPSPCTHERIKFGSYPKYTSVWKQYGQEWPATARSDVIVPMNEVLAVGKSAFGQEDSFFRAQARKEIDRYTRVADEVSLLNNIVELDDLPKLINKYRDLAQEMMRRKRVVLNDFKVHNVSTGKIRGGDEPNYLDWQFALRPLLADIQTVANNFRDASARLDAMTGYNPRTVSFGRRYELAPSSRLKDVRPELTLSFRGPFSGTLSGQLATFVPGLSEASFQLKMLADMIGLHIDAKFIYDAIPFTWLLDWFLPIGNYLGTLNSRKWVSVDIDGQLSISTKWDASFTISGYGPSLFHGWQVKTVTESSGTVRLYKRRTVNFGALKTGDLKPVVPDFTLQRGMILGSLAQGFITGRKNGTLLNL